MDFRDYVQSEEKTLALVHLMEALDEMDSLNESDTDILVESVLKKVGLHAHKSKGLLSYIKSFTTGVGKLFLALLKGDGKKAKEILKSVNKEDVLDFLLKLDTGTLHLISGPLHTLDAWTGWHIGANIKAKMEKGTGIVNVIKDNIAKVKTYLADLYKNDKDTLAKLHHHADKIEQAVA